MGQDQSNFKDNNYEKHWCVKVEAAMHLSQNWIDYKFVVQAAFGSPATGVQYGQKLVISRLIEHEHLEGGNMLRGQLYRRRVPLCAMMLRSCSKTAHNRATNVFMDIDFFHSFITFFYFLLFVSFFFFFFVSNSSFFSFFIKSSFNFVSSITSRWISINLLHGEIKTCRLNFPFAF